MDKETEARTVCREAGLTCRRHPTKGKVYQIVDRESKTVVIDEIPLSAIHRNCMSGFISCYDPVTKTFDRGKLQNLDLFDTR